MGWFFENPAESQSLTLQKAGCLWGGDDQLALGVQGGRWLSCVEGGAGLCSSGSAPRCLCCWTYDEKLLGVIVENTDTHLHPR